MFRGVVNAMSISITQKLNVWKKLLWLTFIFLVLLFLDYTYHERMVATSFRNYEWLGFYRYGIVMDFRYSVDVLVGAWSYVLILGYGLLRRRLSSVD
jgi:hypothetical protein